MYFHCATTSDDHYLKTFFKKVVCFINYNGLRPVAQNLETVLDFTWSAMRNLLIRQGNSAEC